MRPLWPVFVEFNVTLLYYVTSSAKVSTATVCDPRIIVWYPVFDRPYEFSYCSHATRRFVIGRCHKVRGVQKIFDFVRQRCISPKGLRRSPGIPKSSKFGEACMFNTDCFENMYCQSGTCVCVSGYVNYNSLCYNGVNPEQTGCVLDIQCAIAWPGATCDTATSICKCPQNPSNPPVPRSPVVTRDGVMCAAAGTCPLPEGFDTPANPSELSAFLDLSNAGTRQMCTYLSTDTSADRDNFCDMIRAPSVPLTGEYVGDLYNCIPLDLTVNGPTPGICCPSRALTCIQPKPATVATGKLRFWFNSATGDCTSFFWDSSQENPSSANNFQTYEHCIYFCKNGCSRGSAELTGATNGVSTGRDKQCLSSTSSECGSRYQCTEVGSGRRCCPNKDWICSNLGGRSYLFGTAAPTRFDVGAGPAFPIEEITRWYYDSNSRSCIQFQYLQFGGNYNNFATADECQNYCDPAVCTRGSSLKDSTGKAQICSTSGSNRCPSTYDCIQNVCCPKPQTVCSQSLARGSCAGSIPSYWYNPITRDCEFFYYSGCDKNDNNFPTYAQCINYCTNIQPAPRCLQGDADKDPFGNYYKCTLFTAGCRQNYECYYDGSLFGCCPTKSYTCSLQPQIGSVCGLSVTRWYYNTVSASCQVFNYLGCDGNSNNFITRQQCELYCHSGVCPFGGEPYRSTVSSQITVCDAIQSCPLGYDCHRVTVVGSISNYCCLTRANICTQQPNGGTSCGSVIERYYFDPSTKECRSFTYYGCAGNMNNFATVQQCKTFCDSLACPAGEAVLYETNNRIITCSTSAQRCPPNYSCRLDSVRRTSVCCGSSNSNGVCPFDELPYLDPFTGLAKECLQTVTANCPPNFLCRSNSARNRNFCCAPSIPTAVCPIGKAPFVDDISKSYRTCFVGVINQCPLQHSCQPVVANQFQGYCCTTDRICPEDAEYAIDANSGNPKQCMPPFGSSLFACPDSFSCYLSIGATSGFCCRTKTPEILTCPRGMAPLLEIGSNQPRRCSVSSNNCLFPGFSCQTVGSTSNTICCAFPGECPDNRSPLKEQTTGATVLCPLSENQCSTPGFNCIMGSNGVNLCCSTPNPLSNLVCPFGRPFVTYNCSSNVDCPINYECLKSNGDAKICCQSKRQICSQVLNSGNACQSGATAQRFYYNALLGSCQPFLYLGCNGNDNNFLTITECDSFCANGICERGAPLRQGSWFHFCAYSPCPDGYQCTRPSYGPSVWKICCPTLSTVCQLQLNNGVVCSSGAGMDTRFYYNSFTQQCEAFNYMGCSGNGNNFESVYECNSNCRLQPPSLPQCPNIQSLWINPTTKFPQACYAPFRCPLFYRCTYITSVNNYYCCGPTTVFSFGCPNGGTPFLYLKLNLPLACNARSVCPTGYSCQQSISTKMFYCCPMFAKDSYFYHA